LDTLSPEILAAFYELREQRRIEKETKERIEELKAILNPALKDNFLIDPVTGTVLLERIIVKKQKFDKESFYSLHKELYESYCSIEEHSSLIIKLKE